MTAKKILLYLLLNIYCVLSLNAQTWSTVGDSTQIINYDSVTPGGTVYVIKQLDSLLYVGGAFRNVGNMKVMCISTWDGTKWDSLGSGLYSPTYDVSKFENEIYIGGDGGFVKFNGNTWSTVGTGLTVYSVNTLINYNNKLCFGGGGFQLNSSDLHNIASWDGSGYSGFGSGISGAFGQVHALVKYNNELIAGGVFSYAGGNVAFNIAAWDGNNWHALDTGTSGVVNALVVDTINNFLYVGGGFNSIGGINGINTQCIVRWDGFEWDSIGSGLPYCDVMALCMYRNNLFAGMCLNSGIAKWDGKKWEKPDSINDAIFALGIYKDELYVGGAFTKIGQDSIISLARYYEPPSTTCDYLQAIIQPKNAILKISDSTTVHFYNNIMHGSSWHWNFGDGEYDTVRTPIHTFGGLGVYNVSVVVKYQNCMDTAYTTITIVDDTGIKDNNEANQYLGQNIPNPFKNTTTIPYYMPNGSKGSLQICDVNGKFVKEYDLQQGKNELDVSLSQLKSGVYYYSIFINGAKRQTLKMLIN